MDKRPTIQDIMEQVSGELSLITDGERVYLAVSFYSGDWEHDFGIYDSCEVGKTTELEIPDLCIDGHFDFLRTDDMKNHYKIRKEDIDSITEKPYSEWADTAKSLGYEDFFHDTKDLCDYFRKGGKFLRELSKEEMDEIRKSTDEVDLENIQKYNKMRAEMDLEEPDFGGGR